jgi:hypothetical protein
VILKVVPKAAYDPENCSESRIMNGHLRKSTNEGIGGPEQKCGDLALEVLSEQ